MSTPKYSIGVVTYHARFETYFKPLIEKMVRIFPDKDIICIINGHPDRTLQIAYLKKVVSFLQRFPNVRYLTYDTNQSLSKCWNQLIILSNTPQTLILNDDTSVSDLFRSELEEHIKRNDTFTLNKSWSHFVISKDTVKKVGWFDERFLGVGQEDGDYAYRMTMKHINTINVESVGLRNFVGEQKNPGWSNISKTTKDTRYADVNKDFFNKKWTVPWNSPENTHFEHVCQFNGLTSPFTLVKGMETPLFYEFSVLDIEADSSKTLAYTPSILKIQLQKIYYNFGRIAARHLRKFKLK